MLLALALITFTVARPFSEQIGQKPVQAVLLVDGSASMQAQDVQPSRFARAIEAARSTLAGLPENSLATAVLVATHAQPWIPPSTAEEPIVEYRERG